MSNCAMSRVDGIIIIIARERGSHELGLLHAPGNHFLSVHFLLLRIIYTE